MAMLHCWLCAGANIENTPPYGLTNEVLIILVLSQGFRKIVLPLLRVFFLHSPSASMYDKWSLFINFWRFEIKKLFVEMWIWVFRFQATWLYCFMMSCFLGQECQSNPLLVSIFQIPPVPHVLSHTPRAGFVRIITIVCGYYISWALKSCCELVTLSFRYFPHVITHLSAVFT
jgi:hypothetical protein